ncbi:MAG: hypothetical protein HY376_00260 [Candidatus Blackburnbacteria bacterium]|nr:hypothetical protein [Candidatus Blackburnbacteria bacterium]
MEKPRAHPRSLRLFFFWAGIIATFAYRIIVIVNNYSKFWAQIAWYIGTIGFVIYFAHRYQISEKRARLIREHGLEEKISKVSSLGEDDRLVMSYIFSTLKTSLEKWNYIFIFAASAVALFLGVYLDFLRPLL